jgi:hypothetical protein
VSPAIQGYPAGNAADENNEDNIDQLMAEFEANANILIQSKQMIEVIFERERQNSAETIARAVQRL